MKDKWEKLINKNENKMKIEWEIKKELFAEKKIPKKMVQSNNQHFLLFVSVTFY